MPTKMYKLVNGVKVEMTPREVADREAEVAAWEAERQKYLTEEKYKEDRAEEYPPMGDQLDAILKQLNYMRMNGQPLVQELDDIIGDWLRVKQDHPKPEERTDK